VSLEDIILGDVTCVMLYKWGMLQ